MWRGVRHKCTVWIGGDLPWLKRLLGISVCPQVASLYHEGVWDPVEEAYMGCEIRRSDDTDAALHEMYTQDGRSLDNRGCIGKPILTHPNRLNFVACVLHCSMAMGKLFCLMLNEFVTANRSVDKVALQQVLTEAKTGFTIGSQSAPDGEDTHRLFNAWDSIAEVLGVDPCSDRHRAVVGIREMISTMYVTYQDAPLPPNYCARRIQAFQEHCLAPGKAGHYISLLNHDFDLLMARIFPFGLAMFCNDVIESLNRFFKLAYNEHSNRGGGRFADSGVDEESGLPNKHFDAQGAVLVQCFQWVFLYFDIHLVVHGQPRPKVGRSTEAFEPTVHPPLHLYNPSSRILHNARQARAHRSQSHRQVHHQVFPHFFAFGGEEGIVATDFLISLPLGGRRGSWLQV